FSIEKTIFTHPDLDAVVMKIVFTRNEPDLQLYLLHNAAVANTGLGDTGKVVFDRSNAMWPEGLYAWEENDAHAVHSSLKIRYASVAFAGKWDGYQDLKSDFKMDHTFYLAEDGN